MAILVRDTLIYILYKALMALFIIYFIYKNNKNGNLQMQVRLIVYRILKRRQLLFIYMMFGIIVLNEI